MRWTVFWLMCDVEDDAADLCAAGKAAGYGNECGCGEAGDADAGEGAFGIVDWGLMGSDDDGGGAYRLLIVAYECSYEAVFDSVFGGLGD